MNEATIHYHQLISARLLEYACDGLRGRSERDPVYLRQITEGRDSGAMRSAYSSCGDLAHWLLYRQGVRLPWINRTEHEGWRWSRLGKPQNNVSLLCGGRYGHNPLAVRYRAGMQWEPGDIGVIYHDKNPNNTHVFCVVQPLDDDVIQTAEGGQPGTTLHTRAIRGGCLCAERPGGLWHAGRAVQWRLPLRDVLCAGGLAKVDLPAGIV